VANKYRTIPTEVYAVQWDGADHQAITKFVGTKLRAIQAINPRKKPVLNLQTLTGNVSLDMGDYLVMDKIGNFTAVKPFEFESNHELVKDDEQEQENKLDIKEEVEETKETKETKETRETKETSDELEYVDIDYIEFEEVDNDVEEDGDK
jgi:hypothetical protein